MFVHFHAQKSTPKHNIYQAREPSRVRNWNKNKKSRRWNRVGQYAQNTTPHSGWNIWYTRSFCWLVMESDHLKSTRFTNFPLWGLTDWKTKLVRDRLSLSPKVVYGGVQTSSFCKMENIGWRSIVHKVIVKLRVFLQTDIIGRHPIPGCCQESW